ncbi:GlcG/HbpS family heme-binding protein [Wenxinia marina]|uniref:Uncharacterized protein, possibly involved in utilization of glycolate and propanediol n=1 Tax=Wenxinia marina DSM 24838 TaxID=1123501 RepID=A0A0D0PC02_9RHOB|nr:heme-binding protein [Wenxinia marina]KIQ69001.1 Uncharacterized protein, possibly involved in utilization of glycolate and propanediol [Wenxinia marina DSM 24838]GGL81038.1 hypothetical protein GCM10011392_39530 [Wenxinia marina]
MVYPVASSLTLAQADAIAEAAIAYRRSAGFLPLTAVVLDAGGQLVTARREDGCGIVRFDVAFAKAWGSVGMGLPARTLGERLGKNPAFLGSIVAASDGRMAPNAGGVLILDNGGTVIGAVGISGDTGDNDEICAREGIATAGLRAAD